MTITGLHGYVLGFALIGSWAVICGWALALRFLPYSETPTFWRAVSVAQILLGLQILAGTILLVMGRRPGPDGGGRTLAFHIAYGLVFPLVTLVVGHTVARGGRYSPHSVFALVGLILFGLTARSWMVGTAGV
jgi:hypothetical protein